MHKTRHVKKLLFKKAAYPLKDMIPLLESWFESDVGKELQRQEKNLIDQHLESLFGYHLLQVGVSRHICLFENSKIGHRFILSPKKGGASVGIIDEEQLPIATEAVDVVLLHHVLEYTQRPHQLLNEAARLVVPSGHLLIIGFNPYSFIGLWSLFGQYRGKTVWNNRLLSLSRVADWLTLLNFSVQSAHYGFYKLPINKLCLRKHPSWWQKIVNFLQLPFGGCYVLLAKKEVSTLTPIKPKWHRNSHAIIPMMEPSLYTPKPDKNTKVHNDK
jgi:SAM-dependent methyltransferase